MYTPATLESLTKEEELGPEEDHTKERVIDRHAVQESARDAWRTHSLRRRVDREFCARLDQVPGVGAVWLSARARWLAIAEFLRAKGCILRSDDHGQRIIQRQDRQHQHDGGYQQRLRRGMALSDLEYPDPEESDANHSDSHDRAAEEKQRQQREESVVDRKYASRFQEDPIQRIEDVDLAEDVSAMLLADGILCLVDSSQEHRDPRQKRK